VFEYSIRDFFEPQNVVEACWFRAFFTQFWKVFEDKSATPTTQKTAVQGTFGLAACVSRFMVIAEAVNDGAR
jgi:hypothetical protein